MIFFATFNRRWTLHILLSFKDNSKRLKVHLLDTSTANWRYKQVTEHRSFFQLFLQLFVSFSRTLNGFLYAKSYLLSFSAPIVKLYIVVYIYIYTSSPSHQFAVWCVFRLKVQFCFDAANFSVCFLLAIYRAICLQLWLEETFQFFFFVFAYFSLLYTWTEGVWPYYHVRSFCITLQHFTDENSRWKLTCHIWRLSWWSVDFGTIICWLNL